MIRTVQGLLAEKGSDVVGIPPDATVFEAVSLMAEHNVGAVIVLDERRLVGILSERDYARKIILLDRMSRETLVSEIMTADVQTVSPDDSIDRCMEMMTAGRYRHLPVVDGEEVIGVISIGDVVRVVIELQQALIGDLERYITG